MSSISSSTAADTSKLTQSQTAYKTLTGNFQDFLQMFVAQLQHQDPLEPMNTSDFTNSLANLSSVEQAVNMNSNMEKLVSLYQATQTSNLAGYIGKNVEVNGSQFQLENGSGAFSYTLDADAQAVPIAITDANNKLVLQVEGNATAGKHAFSWDGKDANGNQLPDGIYKVTVGAADVDGNITPVSTTGKGRVTGINMENGTSTLEVLNNSVSLDNILSLSI